MKAGYAISLTLILIAFKLNAQPPCGSNPSANDFCSSATPICNLNGYCGNTSASYTNYVSSTNNSDETNTPLGSVFCASIQNNSWVKFIASDVTAVFNVWVSNCAIGKGVQMQIYTTTDCYNFTAVSNCWNPMTPTNGQITATGLIVGQVYYFMIDGTMGDNCDYVISTSSGVATTPTISANQQICNGHTATITATGGSSYIWSSNPADPSLTSQNTAASITVSPTVTTTYTVSVTVNGDNSFCPNSSNELTSVVTVNTTPTVDITSTEEHCYLSDGTLTANVTEGTSPYSYSWNTSPAQTTQIIQNLAEGTYNVTVTDNNGCTTVSSSAISNTDLTVEISGPPALCNGASTTLDAGSNYSSYLWSNWSTNQTITVSYSSNYSVTVSDSNGCTATDMVTVTFSANPTPTISGNTIFCSGTISTLDAGTGYQTYLWNNHASTENITINNAGVYGVTVTNSSGCTGSASINTIIMDAPHPNAGEDDSICGLNYQLQAIPSTETGIWTYNGPGSIVFSSETDATVTASISGVYHFIWTETNSQNCSSSDAVLITFLPIPTSNFTASDIACLGTNSTITYTGNMGTSATYTWNWNGGTSVPGTGIGPNQVSWATPGTYTISLIVSKDGCTSAETSVQVANPNGMTSSLTKTDILCHGLSTGSVNLTVTGGYAPYTYHWNNWAGTEDLININAGTYIVTITDAGGCTHIDGITVNEPDALIASTTPSQTICSGDTVVLNLSTTGGTPPYLFYWNNQSSGTTITVSPASTTTYSAYVTDAYGCTSSHSSSTVTVLIPSPINPDLFASSNYICSGDAVQLTPYVSGGVGAPYTIYNQQGDTINSSFYVYPFETNYYWIRAEDRCGTEDTAGVTIHVYPLPLLSILADFLQGCVPLTVHFIEENADSGQTYLWNLGDANNLSLSKYPVHTYTESGTYSIELTVTSIHGCKTTDVINDMITVWPKPNAVYMQNPEIVTEVEPEIQFENYSTLASEYMWFFGDGDSTSDTNPYHSYRSTGTYQIMLIAITDKGCKDTATSVTKVLPQNTFYAPTAFSPDNDGINDAFYVMGHAIQTEDFKLEIYDRWGEVIWVTRIFYTDTGQSEKWDGKAKNGHLAPVGTYTWQVFYRDSFHRLHEKAGAVNVIR